jgi:hypothetical protein
MQILFITTDISLLINNLFICLYYIIEISIILSIIFLAGRAGKIAENTVKGLVGANAANQLYRSFFLEEMMIIIKIIIKKMRKKKIKKIIKIMIKKIIKNKLNYFTTRIKFYYSNKIYLNSFSLP